MPDTHSTQKLAHASVETAPQVGGRRDFFVYRDLGVTEASLGKLRAQTVTAMRGMTEPTGWHYHVCEGQFVYGLKGWVDLEFETGEKIRVGKGESLFIPGGMRHNENRGVGRSRNSGAVRSGRYGHRCLRSAGLTAAARGGDRRAAKFRNEGFSV